MSAPPPPGGITAVVLGPLLAGDPHRPRLVWHGVGRTELSTASLANWSAKAAGLLVDELGARPPGTVVWRVRRSWQGVPLLLGAWWAGLTVIDDEAVLNSWPGSTEPVAAFLGEGDDSAADEVIIASTHPFGLATGGLPDHQRPVADAVLPQADRFTPRGPAPAADSLAAVTAAGSFSVAELVELAAGAGALIGPAGRVLSTLDLALPESVVTGLLGSLSADGSLIQVTADAGVDQDGLCRIAAEEAASSTLGCDVPGLPRLDRQS